MAEFAEQTLQEMVPEFEELESLGLLTSKEIKKLIVKRRNFEYKICKPQKEVQDFFAYTLYDIHLLELLSIRRQKILLMKKYHKIEISMANRVLKRLRMMTNIWKGKSFVWKLRLAFAKFRKRFEEVSTIYAEQVKFHGADESIWVSWAQWEAEGRVNFDEARKILLSRAPELHPKSFLLRKEYFKLELLYIQHLKEKKLESGGGLDEIIAENREKVLNCAVPEAIFESALKEFNTPNIYDQFFWIAHEFSFASHLRDKIYSEMVKQFPNDIQLCKLKAKLIMSDYIISENSIEEAEENKKEISDAENSDDIISDHIINENSIEEENKKEISDAENSDNIISDHIINENSIEEAEENKKKISDAENSDNIISDHIINESSIEEAEENKNEISDAENSDNIISDHIINENSIEAAEENKKEISDAENSDNIISKSMLSPKLKMNNLFDLYNAALSNIGSSAMEFVIEDLLNILNQVWGSNEYRTFMVERLLNIFNSHSSSLTPAQLLIWFTVASAENDNSEELKTIIELARKKYPDCQDIMLASLRFTSPTSLKEKLNRVNSASGSVGAAICFQLIQNTKKNLHVRTLMERACMHPNDALCAAVRLKLLQSFSELDICRQHYEKYYSIPPFSSRFHATMIKKELQSASVSEEKIRTIFERAISQFGGNQYGLWLCYVEFQEKFAKSKNVSSLLTKAEKQLDPICFKTFINCRAHLQSLMKKKAENDKLGSKNFSDITELPADRSAFEFWARSSLPRLFEKNLDITHMEEQTRTKFFDSLVTIYNNMKESIQNKGIGKKEDENAVWEEIWNLISGQNCSFNPKRININDIGLNNKIAEFINAVDMSGEKSTTSSASITTTIAGRRTASTGGKHTITVLDEETKKLLESSEILKPEFMQQTQITPYYVGRQTLKRQRKKERAKISGDGWFNIKAPEITEEVERDLQILKMRSVLDPRTHYKRNDMKKLPKFFQIGKVVDSPVDFYSSRVPKKERKRTLAEEIMNDESVLRYQKRKCTEILNVKNIKKMKRNQAKVDGKKQHKKKDKTAKGKAPS